VAERTGSSLDPENLNVATQIGKGTAADGIHLDKAPELSAEEFNTRSAAAIRVLLLT